MSRIFDALQRSERERSGTDTAEPSAGPEFLKQAEDHVASKWIDATNGSTILKQLSAESDIAALPVSSLANGQTATDVPDLTALKAEERRHLTDRFKSLRISLPPQSRLVCLTDRDSPTAEALRLLTVRLRDFRRTKPLKKVLITSTIPQEGKSTMAGNLSCALAHSSEERVLLVEGDLRRPSLTTMFGIDAVPGVCQCLHDDGDPLKNIYRLEDTGLWFLPAGKAPSNPLGLLQSPKLSALMDQLTAYFDWIVIDSPPVLPLADTSIWMRIADGILLVTRIGTTQKHQLEKGLEALDSKKMLGALVNSSAMSAYGSYYYRTPGNSN
jgi:capsular exopolysaccharide synthesis family protein